MTETQPSAPADPKLARAALADLMRPARRLVRLAQLLAALSGALAVVPYVVLVRLGATLLAATDSGVPADEGQVRDLLQLLIASFMARLLSYFIALLLSHIADTRLNRSIRERLIAALGRAPLSWFSERTSGLVRKTLQDDVSALHVLVAHKPVDNTVATVMPVALLGYAFVLNWRLGLLAVALIVVFLLTNMWLMRGMGPKTLELDRQFELLSGTMVEFIAGINVVKAFGAVGKAHRRYAQRAEHVNDYYQGWCAPLMTGSALALAIVSAPMMLLVCLGGGAWLAAAGWANPSEVVAVSLIALLLPRAIETVGTQAWGHQMARAAAVRIKALIDCPKLDAPNLSRARPVDNAVELKDVSFAYGDVVALRDVSLRLPEGSVTALVGSSGAGKSTLATLVARFHDPSSGAVRIGGVAVAELAERDLYQRVAFVLQRPELMRATIYDNICLAKPGATEDEVRAAAQAARIHREIASLPHGYDTVLGRDTALSGGQEQRLAIARAILADRPILLLDEATAMTDPDSEAEIQAGLSTLARDKTVLVIAHRPASIRGVDHIVVLDEGRVVAQGTHHELADEPRYRAIWQSTAGEGRQA